MRLIPERIIEATPPLPPAAPPAFTPETEPPETAPRPEPVPELAPPKASLPGESKKQETIAWEYLNGKCFNKSTSHNTLVF